MAVCEQETSRTDSEPQREFCPDCHQPILWVPVGSRGVRVELREWEPRAACQSCMFTRARMPGQRVSCARCGNTGYVGSRRPAERMVAIDVAWGDTWHIRVVGPGTDRRAGEALHRFHHCR